MFASRDNKQIRCRCCSKSNPTIILLIVNLLDTSAWNYIQTDGDYLLIIWSL